MPDEPLANHVPTTAELSEVSDVEVLDAADAADEVEPLLTLLRRFAAEAARDEARLFCDELVAEGRIEVDPQEWQQEWEPVAA